MRGKWVKPQPNVFRSFVVLISVFGHNYSCLRSSQSPQATQVAINDATINLAHRRILRPHCKCRKNESNPNQVFSGHLSSSYLYLDTIIRVCDHHRVHKQQVAIPDGSQFMTADRRNLRPHCKCGENESNPNQMFSGHLSSSYLYLDTIIHVCDHHRVHKQRRSQSTMPQSI